MKLLCPRCRGRAYRVYIQVQDQPGGPRRWLPEIGFLWCREEKGVVREEDHRFLGAIAHRKGP